ncbi:hypothetical protein [Actinomycetospora chiangmaiensis]|uniref:hypothetical protein n=1 Tax=Actinomycetospora chiangmaiensis TaxID=402650 RepID=UPI000364E65D|nr:hypothetical protein [Actinomycetospora chiangmaiensis]
MGLVAACGAGACLLSGCSADAAAVGPPMTLVVSAVTDRPMTVWFDTRQRTPSGLVGEGVDATPVELSPERPAAVVTVPYARGNWLWARVSGPSDAPEGSAVACELRSRAGRVLDAHASDPFRAPPGETGCAGAQ